MTRRILWNAFFTARRLRPYWRELDRFAQLRPDAARDLMAARLLELIRYFGSREDALPEWREAARIHDPRELWRVWPSLPVVRKSDLTGRFHPSALRDLGIEGVVSSTGGSTGEPTPYLHPVEMLRATTATRMYQRLRVGWRPGMATVVVWGSERDIGRQRSRRNRTTAWLRDEHWIDGYHLSEATVDRALAVLRKHRPVAMTGFSSMLEFVARETLRRGLQPEPGTVHVAWNGGEVLFDEQRDLFREAFGVPVLNLYGGREMSVLAFQRREGEPLAVLRPLVYVEIVDDNGKPVAPGESGRVLCTHLACRGTPFVRYEVGDMASYSAGACTEAGIAALDQIQGRIAGLLHLPDGRTINCIYWNHLLKEYDGIHQFQIALRQSRSIEVRLKGVRIEPTRQERLQQTLESFLGRTPVTIRWVEEIPRTAQGKLVQVVHEP